MSALVKGLIVPRCGDSVLITHCLRSTNAEHFFYRSARFSCSRSASDEGLILMEIRAYSFRGPNALAGHFFGARERELIPR